jgi:thymidylate kinase
MAAHESWKALEVKGPPNGHAGRMIVVEGSDGVGKSTVLEHLTAALEKRGGSVLTVRAPTLALRAYPAWRAWFEEDPELPRDRIDGFGLSVMALGDRLVHQSTVVAPALAGGTTILSDRYVLSSLVYESSDIHQVLLSRLIEPDVKILLTAEPETVLRRLADRTYETIHPDDAREKPALMSRYAELGKLNGYTIIRTDCDLEETMAQVMATVEEGFAK